MTSIINSQTPKGVFDLLAVVSGKSHGNSFLGSKLDVSRHSNFRLSRAESSGGSGYLSPQSDFLIVVIVAGELEMTADEKLISLSVGEIAVISPELGLNWRAIGESVWLVNTYRAFTCETWCGLKKINPNDALCPSAPPALNLLVGGVPECAKSELAAAEDGAWSCGLWTAMPYHRVPVRYGYYEMMVLLEGEVTIFSADGGRAEFSAGDVFVISEGAEVGWLSSTPVRKFWSIYTITTGLG